MTISYRSAAATCPNLNHRRSDAPVGYCPQCGSHVNAAIRAAICTEAQHAASRRAQSVFCVHCGQRLIAAR